MSSNADVRDAWATALEEITTANSYGYELRRTNQSGTDLALGYISQNISFIEYIVTSTKRPYMMGKFETTFTVNVRYTVGVTESGAGTGHQAAADMLRTINDLVISSLDTSWSSTVDYYEGPTEPSINPGEWGGKSTIVGETTYTAFQLTN